MGAGPRGGWATIAAAAAAWGCRQQMQAQAPSPAPGTSQPAAALNRAGQAASSPDPPFRYTPQSLLEKRELRMWPYCRARLDQVATGGGGRAPLSRRAPCRCWAVGTGPGPDPRVCCSLQASKSEPRSPPGRPRSQRRCRWRRWHLRAGRAGQAGSVLTQQQRAPGIINPAQHAPALAPPCQQQRSPTSSSHTPLHWLNFMVSRGLHWSKRAQAVALRAAPHAAGQGGGAGVPGGWVGAAHAGAAGRHAPARSRLTSDAAQQDVDALFAVDLVVVRLDGEVE